MRIVVFHSTYGCDTGCCGHSVEVVEKGERKSIFLFDHPSGDHRKFAEGLVRDVFGAEHVADLDWDNCMIVEDEN